MQRRRYRRIRNIWEDSFAYKTTKQLVNASTRSCFNKMVSEGKENIPQDSSIIFASNHACAMLDPLVILADYGKAVSYGARSDVFKNPKVASIMYFLKILPLSRARDGVDALSDNYNTFDNAVKCIQNGLPFCLFPEGTHNPAKGLLPLKKGAARIAIQAAEEGFGKNVYVVPVGLDYEDFFNCGKSIVVRYGKAIPVTSDMNPKDLTDSIHDELVTLIDRPLNTECKVSKIGKIALWPLYILCAVIAAPMLIPAALIIRNIKDPAWGNTIRFSCKFGGSIIYTIIIGIPLLVFLSPLVAVAYILLLWHCHSWFYRIRNVLR